MGYLSNLNQDYHQTVLPQLSLIEAKEVKSQNRKGSRDHDSLRTQLISQKNFYENKFKEMDTSLKKMSEINEKILANQIKEEEIKTANKNKFKEMDSSIKQITEINEKILANQNKKEEKVAKLETIDNNLENMVHSSTAQTKNIK